MSQPLIQASHPDDQYGPLPSGWEARVDSGGRRCVRTMLGLSFFDSQFLCAKILRRSQQSHNTMVPSKCTDPPILSCRSAATGASSGIAGDYLLILISHTDTTHHRLQVASRTLVDDVLESNNSGVSASHNPASLQSNTNGLPPGWEQRFTPTGRPYYVDHTYDRIFSSSIFVHVAYIVVYSAHGRQRGLDHQVLHLITGVLLGISLGLFQLAGKCASLPQAVFTSVRFPPYSLAGLV